MITIRKVKSSEKNLIDDIVTIHLESFTAFFLTFMGRGFLNQMYHSYCHHVESGLLVAEENGKAIGFLAYSRKFSELYKYMIKNVCFLLVGIVLGPFFEDHQHLCILLGHF